MLCVYREVLRITDRMSQPDLLDRTLQFSVDTIRFTRSLPQDSAGWTIGRQVIRSATSIGANYQEAQFSRSRAEFASKAQIALQEASETLYWLRIVEKCAIGDLESLARLTNEANQLVSILVSITRKAKTRV